MTIRRSAFEFNFDEWAALARNDPAQFEDRRRHTVLRVINLSNNARRMEGMQCRIDLERRRARTPMGATIRISSMMWDSVHELKDWLNLMVRRESSHCFNRTAVKLPSSARIVHLQTAKPGKATASRLQPSGILP